MAKTGRPPKNGVKPGWMLGRAVMVLYAYEKARKQGMKHSSAVTEAATRVSEQKPGMCVSESEVRRVVAEFRSKYGEECLLVERSTVHGAKAAKRRQICAKLHLIAEGQKLCAKDIADLQAIMEGSASVDIEAKPIDVYTENRQTTHLPAA